MSLLVREANILLPVKGVTLAKEVLVIRMYANQVVGEIAKILLNQGD